MVFVPTQGYDLYQHRFMRSSVSSSGQREQRLPGDQVTQRPVGRDGQETCLLRVLDLKRSVCPKDAIWCKYICFHFLLSLHENCREENFLSLYLEGQEENSSGQQGKSRWGFCT